MNTQNQTGKKRNGPDAGIWVRMVIMLAALGVVVLTIRTLRPPADTEPDSPPAPATAPGAEEFAAKIEVMAQSCAACHGTDGALHTSIPPLAGKPALIMQSQLLAFREDQMPGATVMPRLARGYTEEELRALARHFAELPPGGTTRSTP